MDNAELKDDLDSTLLERAELLKIEKIIREEKSLKEMADTIKQGARKGADIVKKDSIDKFLEFVLARVRTGGYHIDSLAFPTRRIADKELEDKVIKLINIHLYPDIVQPILKYFARNVKDSDKNLYLAYLINSEEIIKSIYETFLLFKKDVFVTDPVKRTLNVKRIQQLSSSTDNGISSPLDAACRFKYILEFIALKQNVERIYTAEQIRVSED